MREDKKCESPLLFDSTCTRGLKPRYLNITAFLCSLSWSMTEHSGRCY